MGQKQDHGDGPPGGGEPIVGVEPPEPPQPPDLDKAWTFYPFQVVGIPLLALISVAALLGAFGDQTATSSAAGGGLTMEVEHPARFRFKMVDPLSVTVSNDSGAPIGGVTVMVDGRYLDSFSGVAFTPAPSHVDEDWWVFDLGELASGSTAVVAGQVQAESFWMKEGSVRLGAEAISPVEVSFSTFVFP